MSSSFQSLSIFHNMYFSVATEPAMMPATAMNDPMASVESPDKPWPMVHPSAVTPPKPISTAPISWLRRSSMEAKPSQRKVLLPSA